MDTYQTDEITKIYLPIGGHHKETIELVSVPNNATSLKRVEAYNSIGEQLDMIFHDIENGTLDKTGSFYQYILSVKSDHPKS